MVTVSYVTDFGVILSSLYCLPLPGGIVLYVKPHILKVKNTEFLIFDECDDIFINNYKDNIIVKILYQAEVRVIYLQKM